VAIVLVQETVNTDTNPISNADSDTAAFPGNTTSGNLIIVLAWGWRSAAAFAMTTGAVSDNINGSYGASVISSGAQANVTTHIFAFANITGGATTITVNPDSTANYFGWYAAEYSGMATTGVVDVTKANNAASSATMTTGASAATAQNDELVISVGSTVSDPTSITVQGSYVQEIEELDGASFQAGEGDSLILTTTGAQTCTWDLVPNSAYTCCLATFKMAAAGGGGTVMPRKALLGVGN
jgi:hypothetical protein